MLWRNTGKQVVLVGIVVVALSGVSACSVSIGGGERTQETILLGTSLPTTSPTELTEVPITDPPATSTTIAARAPLRAGDCFDWDADFVVKVNCEQLHDGQVISPTVVISGELSASNVDALVVWSCGPYYEEVLGSAFDEETSNWMLQPVVIDQESSTVQCSVVKWDEAKWAGTAENFVGGYAGIDVGDCFDFPTETADAVELDCDVAHDGEMYVVDQPVGISGRSAPYPSDDEWWDIASRICDRSFERYTGLSIDDPEVSYTFVYVLEEDWADVDARVLSCAVTYVSGLKISGSLAA